MAADAKSFAISIGVNAAIAAICLLFFCFMRLRRLMRKFYMPRQFMDSTQRAGKPKALSNNYLSWLRPAWSSSQDEIIRVGGYDAAMYIKILSFAFEIFCWIALWTLIIILPTNLVGKEVSTLSDFDNVPTSPYTYWISPQSGAPPSDSPPQRITHPEFYAKTPPAPAGVEWWKLNPGVPPLPDPFTALGPDFAGYAWRYDDKYSAQSYTFSQLDKVTLTNIRERSNLLWIHAIVCYIVAFIVMRRLWKYSKDAVELHLDFLSTAVKGAETHSVIVTDIPGTYAGTVQGFVPEKVRTEISQGVQKSRIPDALGVSTNFVLPSSVPHRRSSNTPRTVSQELSSPEATDVEGGNAAHARRVTLRQPDLNAWVTASEHMREGMTVEEMVRNEYDELFEGDVASVHVVYNTSALDSHVQEYDKGVRDLEDLIDDYASQKARDKSIKRRQTRVLGWRHGDWGKRKYPGFLPVKTDLMDWHITHITELRRQILVEQEKCKTRPGPTAFVTFNTRRSQTIAANSLQHPDVNAWHVASAPAPNEIVWDNVRNRAWERQTRFILVWTLFIVMALFYTIPIAAVQAIIEVNRLYKITFFRKLLDITFIRSIIQAILPGLVLNIFLALLPLILKLMNRQQGMFSHTQIDFGVNRKYFVFLVITVFLGTIIGGSLFNQFNQWFDSPSSAVTILGTAAPLTSIFFLTYILLQAFTSLPVSFLRLFGLIIYWIKSKFAATPRAKARVWSEQRYQFGAELPRHMLILLVGIVFSVINPLVPVMTIVYFAVALLLERYNMLYVFTPQFDSGGKIWAEFYEQVVTALFFFEAIMTALLAIKKSYSAILLAPLIAITIIFWRACRPVFQKPMSALSLRTAVDMDHNDTLRSADIPLEERSEDPEKKITYLMPAMDFHQRRHDSVLAEAANMGLVLDGKKELNLEEIGEKEGEAEDSVPPPTAPGGDSSWFSGRKGNNTSSRFLQPLVENGSSDSASIHYLRGSPKGGEVDMSNLENGSGKH